MLRTNLQFIDPDQERKVFVVTSSLPEEGKTTTATNLAMVLAEGGERVALIEADLRRPKISHYLNLEGAVGLTTVLVGRVSLHDAMQPSSAHRPRRAEQRSHPAQPGRAAQVARDDGDPQGAARETTTSCSSMHRRSCRSPTPRCWPAQADGAILVVRHGKTTEDQVRAAAERLISVGAEPAGVIFNMTPAKGSGEYGYGYGYGYEPEVVTHAETARVRAASVRAAARAAAPDEQHVNTRGHSRHVVQMTQKCCSVRQVTWAPPADRQSLLKSGRITCSTLAWLLPPWPPRC